MKLKTYRDDFFRTIIIMILDIIISFVFWNINLNEATIILVYILGVLFTSSITNGYVYGILASIISVLLLFSPLSYKTLLPFSL